MRTAWKLNTKDLQYVIKQLLFIPYIFFASGWNKKIPKSISYKTDPECVAVDAFTQSWDGLKFFAFLRFIFIPKVLQKKSKVTKKQEYLLSKTGQTNSGVIIYIYNTYINVSFSKRVFLYLLQLKNTLNHHKSYEVI